MGTALKSLSKEQVSGEAQVQTQAFLVPKPKFFPLHHTQNIPSSKNLAEL